MPSPGGSTVPKESGVKGMLLRDRGEGGKEARGRWAQAEVRERWKEKKANSHTLHLHSSYSDGKTSRCCVNRQAEETHTRQIYKLQT